MTEHDAFPIPPNHVLRSTSFNYFASMQADDIYGPAVLPIIRHVPNDLYHTEAMSDEKELVHCTRYASWLFIYSDAMCTAYLVKS